MNSECIPRFQKIRFRFPASLKRLTLQGCHLPWSWMFRIQSLPDLEWEASSINFPCLKRLFLVDCHLLEGIPLEMSEISTLEHIQIKSCDISVIKSADKIRKEQRADGNYDLKIRADRQSLASQIHLF
ncbi:hypothetical protein L1987_38199 [Smallanthus sonchifolius]|uniref:Uncharacterized protein n=1 Tax=Smallanthus sonchifolius TaxID=185202 RepID=A0ACB9HIK0_9ASTR|nr:hypothetical protein L1987_38199 [Smallanthus sonchifolius]